VERVRVAVLISGRGSNLQTLIRAARPDFPAEIVHVVSDTPDAPGLAHGRDAGIPVRVVDRRDHANRAAFEAALESCLREVEAEWVCLAGFMRVLTADFIAAWPDKILNIHPSLLPAFKGLHTHERVLAAGVRFTGCTVHVVRPAVDDGPVIAQAVVPVLPDDTVDVLAARVLEAEHRLYPLALHLVATGKARVMGDRVEINRDLFATSPALFNPGGKGIEGGVGGG